MRFSELDGARIGVWGAGREIESFAAQLRRRLPGARIAVVAFDAPPALDVRALLGAPGARVVAGAETLAALAGCDVLVRSPGVSIHKPELLALRAQGVPVTTATSLWLAEREGRRVIGVTGTKGKSTTAALACHLALAAGVPARLAGNIGLPALELLDADPAELAVVELSSYQVADLAVGPEVAVFTNLYREHTDWHGSEEAYRAEKLRVLGLEGVRAAVLPARQPELAHAATPAARHLFGATEGWDATAAGVARDGLLRIRAQDLPLPGEHNALNLCAALTALDAAGLPTPELPASLRGFEGLEHRLQVVSERHGVTWVDDSISTTPESTLAALASFPGRPLLLLAGGQDRGQDYARLGSELARLGESVVGLPSTGARLLSDARAAGVPEMRALPAADLADAVALARERAGPGAVVLLSPAAPSFDHYRDFKERGERFRALLEVPES
ncbi:MAG: UDP-N-acetylmuramoyl-L-alanine--D-glutamate ligase [Solirubrobacteraceae bacterium]